MASIKSKNRRFVNDFFLKSQNRQSKIFRTNAYLAPYPAKRARYIHFAPKPRNSFSFPIYCFQFISFAQITTTVALSDVLPRNKRCFATVQNPNVRQSNIFFSEHPKTFSLLLFTRLTATRVCRLHASQCRCYYSHMTIIYFSVGYSQRIGQRRKSTFGLFMCP